MTADPALYDRLEQLAAEATPGPWTAATAPAEGSDETAAEYLVGALRPDEGRPLWVVWAPVVEGLHDSDYVVPVVTGDGPTSEANARYLAELHAAAPDLIAAARRATDLEQRVQALAEEMEGAAGLPDTHGEFDRGVAAHQRDAAARLRGLLDGGAA